MMNTTTINVGLLQSDFTCIPTSLDNFLKCGGEDVEQYVLRAVSTHQRINFVPLKDVSGFSNSIHDNYTDTSSLVGQLRIGALNLSLCPLVVTEARAKYMDYGMPAYEATYCFFTSRRWLNSETAQDTSTYFITAFSTKIWLWFISLLVVHGMAKLVSCATSHNVHIFDTLRKITFAITATSCVVIFNLNLKVQFIPTTVLRQPFQTVNELASLVRANQFYLVIDTLRDHRMEIINQSGNSAIGELKKAISMSKIKIVEDRADVLEEVKNNRGAFTIDSWIGFLYYNLPEEQSKLMKICPDELPRLPGTYGFSRQSKLVKTFNKHISFIFGLYENIVKTMENWYDYYKSKSDRTIKSESPLRLHSTWLLFVLFGFSSLCCITALICEVVYVCRECPC